MADATTSTCKDCGHPEKHGRMRCRQCYVKCYPDLSLRSCEEFTTICPLCPDPNAPANNNTKPMSIPQLVLTTKATTHTMFTLSMPADFQTWLFNNYQEHDLLGLHIWNKVALRVSKTCHAQFDSKPVPIGAFARDADLWLCSTESVHRFIVPNVMISQLKAALSAAWTAWKATLTPDPNNTTDFVLL